MHSIDGDYFPVVSPLFATYLHRNLIGTSSELRRIFAVRSPRELRQIADVISAYLCTRIILEILLSVLIAPNIIRVFSPLNCDTVVAFTPYTLQPTPKNRPKKRFLFAQSKIIHYLCIAKSNDSRY